MIKKSIHILLFTVLGQIGSFVILALSARNLSQEDFGIFSLYEAILTIVASFSILSVDRYAQRHYFSGDGGESDENAFRIANAFALIFCSFSLIACILGAFILSNYDNIYIYVLGMLSGGFLAYCGLVLVFAQVTSKANLYGFFVSTKFLYALIVLAIFISGGGTLKLLIYTSVAINGFMAVAAFIILPKPTFCLSGLINQIRPIILYSGPIVLGSISATILTAGSRMVVDYATNSDEVAIYAYWQKLSFGYLLVPGAINVVFLPIIYKLLSKNYERDVFKKLAEPIKFIYFYSAAIFLFNTHIYNLIFGGESFVNNYLLFGTFLAISYVSSVMGATTDLFMMYYRRTVAHSLFFIVSALISAIFGYLLSENYGINGMAFALLFSIFIAYIANNIYLIKRNGINLLNFQDISRIIAIMGISIFLHFLQRFSIAYFELFLTTISIFLFYKILLTIVSYKNSTSKISV